MSAKFQKIWFASAILAFVFCMGGGLWILAKTGFDHGNDAVSTGLGLYFIGKAFFVGPMLLIVAARLKNDK